MRVTETQELRHIICEVGKSLGRSDEEIKALCEQLIDKDWFESVEALRRLSDDEWAALNVPKRFAKELRDRVLAESECKPSVKLVSSTEVKSSGHETTKKPPAVCYSPPDPSDNAWAKASVKDTFMKVLETLKQKPSNDQVDCLRALRTIVSGALTTPEDHQKRRIRIANPNFQRRVEAISGCRGFLESIGFVEAYDSEASEKYLCLPTLYFSRFTDADSFLSEALRRRGIEDANNSASPSFNPYRANLATTRPSDMKPVDHSPERDPTTLRKLIKQEEKRLSSCGNVVVPLNKMIFPPGARLPHVEIESYDAHEDASQDGAPLQDFTQESLAHLKEVLGEGGRKFQSRARKQLEDLRRQKACGKCTLRVHAPDRSIVQLDFRADTKVRDVMQILISQVFSEDLRHYLSGQQQTLEESFCLTESPPLRQLNVDNSLFQENLIPSGNVRLSFKKSMATYRGQYFSPH